MIDNPEKDRLVCINRGQPIGDHFGDLTEIIEIRKSRQGDGHLLQRYRILQDVMILGVNGQYN